MTENRYDITIDGVNARLDRSVEVPFEERFVRAEATQNVLSQSETPGLTSRPDQSQLYQTDWSGGSKWQKPLLAGSEANSFFSSANFDTWSEPGKIVPLNTFETPSVGATSEPKAWAWLDDSLYASCTGQQDTAGFRDVYKWTPASSGWVRESGVHSGVVHGEWPTWSVGDPSDGYIYTLVPQGDEIVRYNPTTDANDAAWLATPNLANGANIFIHQGAVMFYNGDQIYSIAKAGPTATSVFNDGLGFDTRAVTSTGIGNGTVNLLKRAIATPEGIYYVKHVDHNNTRFAYVYRVDLDEAGNWIGNPIATLPNNLLVFQIAYHMGSLIFTATSNPTANEEVTLYHITQGSMGVIGSFEGDKNSTPYSDMPYYILGAHGPYLYFTSEGEDQQSNAVWVYDGINGGLHRAYADQNVTSLNFRHGHMAVSSQSSGHQILLFSGVNASSQPSSFFVRAQINQVPDTVTAFGDDEAHYILESNYFDMNLPMETKEITKVAIICDAASTASAREWTLQLSTDDGAFADVLTHSGVAQYAESSVTAGTHRGRLFRYKVIYQTKNAQKGALRAILITANSGQMIREIEVALDGESLVNVQNQVVRPAAFAESLRATAAKEEAITVALNFQDNEPSADTSESASWKVMGATIRKTNADESKISVVLREI